MGILLASIVALFALYACGDDTKDDGAGGSGGTIGQGGSGGSGGSGGHGGSGGGGGSGGSGGDGGIPQDPLFSSDPLVYTATVGSAEGRVCYDFDAEEEVDCDGAKATWDLMFEVANRSYNLWTNGGIYGAGDGAAFGPMTPDDAVGTGSSRSIPGWFRDFLGGVFIEYPWYEYNVMGTHDISANSRVYVVDTDTDLYRVQVISYYGAGGASGMVRVRWGLLSGTTYEEVELDATAGGFGAPIDDPKNRFAYLDLDAGVVVEIDDATARNSNTIWDIAFKRYDVILNGGASGPGSVKAAIADAQDALYDSDGNPIKAQFAAMTEQASIDAFLAVTSADGLAFTSDVANPYITNDGGPNSWFGYEIGGTGPRFFANPDAWWAVRSAEGDSFAKLHVTEVDSTERAFTVEMFVQKRPD